MPKHTVAKSYYAGEVSDLTVKRLSERELENELFKKKPEDIVRSFEESQGIRSKKPKKLNIRNKIQGFDITVPEDKELFEELINNPKYSIIHYRDTFTVGGEHRIICIYSEDLDYEKNNKEDKEERDE